MDVNIRLAEQALQFQPGHLSVYENLNTIFQQQLEIKLDLIMRHLEEGDKPLYETSVNKLNAAGGIEGIPGLLSAPEFIARILDYPFVTSSQIYTFLMHAADAGIAQKTAEFDHETYPYLWTANGDYFIRFDKVTRAYNGYNAFKLNDAITLDFFSPNCIRIDSVELGEDPSATIEEYDYEEAYRVYEKLEECVHPLSAFSNPVAGLITNFTRTIILKKQLKKEGMMFSSASLFPYIGRSVLINAHGASPSQVIDALVHESIHSLLYTIDAIEKWMPSNDRINKAGPAIISPWTGKPLNPGNFCQAIFVWYGLFNFWQLALANNAYDNQYGEKRIAMIQKGFQEVDIDFVNKNFDLQLKDIVLETVEEVKATVLQNSPIRTRMAS